jgi:hypothetical protein
MASLIVGGSTRSSSVDNTAEEQKTRFADIRGPEAAKGTCHKCGGGLARGNSALACLCGTCGTRFHTSDCGARLANSGYTGSTDVCPKVRAPSLRSTAPPPLTQHSHKGAGARVFFLETLLEIQPREGKDLPEPSLRALSPPAFPPPPPRAPTFPFVARRKGRDRLCVDFPFWSFVAWCLTPPTHPLPPNSWLTTGGQLTNPPPKTTKLCQKL